MNIQEHIQYIEFTSPDFDRIKAFYTQAFGWEFTKWGEEYISFNDQSAISGGFSKGEVRRGSVLVILYSEHLEGAVDRVKKAGGEVTKEIFSFPGGRRFHFADPDGNQLAVWSKE